VTRGSQTSTWIPDRRYCWSAELTFRRIIVFVALLVICRADL